MLAATYYLSEAKMKTRNFTRLTQKITILFLEYGLKEDFSFYTSLVGLRFPGSLSLSLSSNSFIKFNIPYNNVYSHSYDCF